MEIETIFSNSDKRDPVSRCSMELNSMSGNVWFLLFIQPTLLGTNISPEKSMLKMIFLFPRWGYVNFLEGISYYIPHRIHGTGIFSLF